MFELSKSGKSGVCGLSQMIIEVNEYRIRVEKPKTSRGRATNNNFKVLEFFKSSRITKSGSGSFVFRFPTRGAQSEYEEVELIDFSDEIIQALRACILTPDKIPGVASLNLAEKSEVLQILFDDQPKICSVPKKQLTRARKKNVNQSDNSSDVENAGDLKSEDGEYLIGFSDSDSEDGKKKTRIKAAKGRGKMTPKQAPVEEPLTDLEKFRLQNIERNKQRMAELGVLTLKNSIKSTPKSQQPPKRKKPQKPDNSKFLPSRSSKRIKGLQADGSALTNDDNQYFYSPGSEKLPQEDYERHAMETFQLGEKLNKNEQQIWTEIYNTVRSEKSNHGDEQKDEKKQFWFQNQDYNCLNQLELGEDCVQKIAPKGISVLQFCPLTSESFCVLATGDKVGTLSLWKFDIVDAHGKYKNNGTNTKSDKIISLDIHKKFLSGLSWSTFENQKLFTCSYDGSIRALDVEKQENFVQFSSEEDMFSGFDLWDGKNTGMVATYDGFLKFLDFREKNLVTNEYELHSRKINCVHLEPVQQNRLLTCCNDGSVVVWDVRKMQDQSSNIKQQKLFELGHSRSCQSGYFSPDGSGRILTTCYDNKLRVWAADTEGVKSQFSVVHDIVHDNNTGRWVTPFRAVWSPSGKSILCGDMKRAVNIYDLDFENGTFKNSANLRSEYMTAIPSRLCVNTAYPVVAAATSSGRVHMYL